MVGVEEARISLLRGSVLSREYFPSSCYLQFVAIAFYCIYMCMNFVHSCVWQLFLKNKRWDEMSHTLCFKDEGNLDIFEIRVMAQG